MAEYIYKEKSDGFGVNIQKERELVRCKDCWKRRFDNCPFNEFAGFVPTDDWFCADGERK